MSKRLLREADDSFEYDDATDPWIAKFTLLTSPTIEVAQRPLKMSKKIQFLEEDDEDSDLEKQKENLLGALHTVQDVDSKDMMTILHKRERQTSTTGVAPKAAVQTDMQNDDRHKSIQFDDDGESPHGRASFCISDDYRPVFPGVDFKQPDRSIPFPAPSSYPNVDFFLNHHISRYLMDHQVEGIDWLWSKYLSLDGAILADDMGMGKTIQITGLLSILFQKTGLALNDKARMKQRKQQSVALSSSSCSSSPSALSSFPSSSCTVDCYYLKVKPCLITCPKSLVDNWYKEIQRWGYFTVDVLHSKLSSDDIEIIFSRADQCLSEILLVSYSQIDRFCHRLESISWSMIVFDEGHKLKNTNLKLYQQILNLKKTSFRLVATGTPIQNDLRELWAILHLVDQQAFSNRQYFIKEFEKPIKFGIRANAAEGDVDSGKEAILELMKVLKNYMLGRKKNLLEGISPSSNATGTDALLKGKEEVIVLCDLSPLQRDLYEYCLQLPDFDNVRFHAFPCPCGSKKPRGKCCLQFRIPYKRNASGEIVVPTMIDPRAVLWSNFHPNHEPCGSEKSQRCPLCILLPCLSILNKISCHPALLQYDPTSGATEKQEKMKKFALEALSPDLLQRMGGSQRSIRFMDMKSTAMSGKMKTLHDMLGFFVEEGERTLIFSLSTQVLDMIEAMVKSQGWSSLRLDGQTQSHRRQQMVDEFNDRRDIMIFLISSRAGGLGLNLCTATKVIIFDVDWNPVVDMQSQDRAYRIGQKQQLVVYRLVSKGTIEEMTYMRQLYKQQLQNAVPIWQETTTTKGFKRGKFVGVDGEANMRGELFGIENLLQFSATSILQSLRAKYDQNSIKRKNKADINSIPGLDGLDKVDVQEAMEQLAKEVANYSTTDRTAQHNKPFSAGISLLEIMGINIKNAHRLDEMLGGTEECALNTTIEVVPKEKRTSESATTKAKYSSSELLFGQALSNEESKLDLLDLDNRERPIVRMSKQLHQENIIDLTDSDERDGKEIVVGDRFKDAVAHIDFDHSMKPRTIAEIFVRRIIRPHTDCRNAQSKRYTEDVSGPSELMTKQVVPTTILHEAQIKQSRKRKMPNLKNSLQKSRPSTCPQLYIPKY